MKKYLYSLIALLVLGVAAVAYANPLQFVGGAASATASSSPVHMTAGTATTTVYYDTFNQAGTNQTTNLTNNNAVNLASFLLQLTASSTNTVANVNFEYAEDNASGVNCATTPSACDWYQDGASFAATSTITNISVADTVTWKYASTTPGLGAHVATNNRDGRIFQVRIPTRYVRAIITLATGSTNGAVYGKFVPLKEVK